MIFAQKMADIVNKLKEVIAITELDDRTQNKEKDAKRDVMLHQAEYRTLRFESKNKQNVEELQKIIYSQE